MGFVEDMAFEPLCSLQRVGVRWFLSFKSLDLGGKGGGGGVDTKAHDIQVWVF